MIPSLAAEGYVFQQHSPRQSSEKALSVYIMESTLTILAIIILSLYVVSMKRADLMEQRQIMQGEIAFLSEGEAISNLDALYTVEYDDLETVETIDTVAVPMRGGGTFQFRREIQIDCVAYNTMNHLWATTGCGNPSFKRATVTLAGPLYQESQFSIAGTVSLDRIYPRDRYLGESENN